MKRHEKVFAVGLLVVVAQSWVSAQEQGGASILVRTHIVDRDQIAQYEGLMVERMEELRGSGLGFRHVFEQVRGNQETYLIITPYDGPTIAASSNWVNAINDVVTSSELVTQQAYPEAFTVELGEDVSVPGQFMYARVRTVAADANEDYYEWQRDELIPALREAGAGDVRTLRVVLGGNINTWIRYSYIDEIPVIGGADPLAESIGDRQFREVMDAGNAMTVSASDFIYRYRPDLSYDMD